MKNRNLFFTIFLLTTLLFSSVFPVFPVFPILAFEEEEMPLLNIISSEEAISLAQLKLSSQNTEIEIPFDEIKTTLVKENGTDLYWYVSFFPAGELSDQVNWIKIEGESGSIVAGNLNEPGDLQALWAETLGPFLNWSLETKALFDKVFLSSKAKPIHDLPKGDEPINQTEAVKQSKKALISTLNLSQEDFSNLFITCDFLLGSNGAADSDPEEGVWAVCFYQNEQGPLLYQVNLSSLDGSIYLLNDNQNSQG